MYEIVTPGGKTYKPPTGTCWKNIEEGYLKLKAEGRIWFGKDGNSMPRRKTYLFEQNGQVAWSWWPHQEVGNTQEAKKEIIALFGASNVFDTPKPERLIQRILTLATHPGDLVLDSFLGSGTTAAVAHKMGRRWIGIELGEHAHTHCAPRLLKVVRGQDPGGISKALNWQGGGGFRFYTLAPTLLLQDGYGQWVINPEYNAPMLAAAVAKHEGFRYEPDPALWWKQARSAEKDYLLVTTQYVNRPLLDAVRADMAEGETLLICCKAFDAPCARLYPEISVKKIPNLLVDRCEYGRDDYSLHIVNLPNEPNPPEDPEPARPAEAADDSQEQARQGNLFD
jgi:adenine-specific DNA-methyltransferase